MFIDEILAVTFVRELLRAIRAIKEATIEELHSDHAEDELKEKIHDQDVEDVLQRVHHAIEHSL
jgi:phosphopantothenate synthetase